MEYPGNFFIRWHTAGQTLPPDESALLRALCPEGAFANARAVRAGPQRGLDNPHLRSGQFGRLRRPGAGLWILPAVGAAAQRARQREVVRGRQRRRDRHELARGPADRPGLCRASSPTCSSSAWATTRWWALRTAHAAGLALCQPPLHQRLHHRQESRPGWDNSSRISARPAWPRARPGKKWQGMESFLASRIAADDPKLKDCYRHFRDNLNDIVQTAHRRGAGVILCTVPTNIRSCAPFGSRAQGGPDDGPTRPVGPGVSGRQGLERARDFAGALSAYEKAGQIDDSYADLAFCHGPMPGRPSARAEEAQRDVRRGPRPGRAAIPGGQLDPARHTRNGAEHTRPKVSRLLDLETSP